MSESVDSVSNTTDIDNNKTTTNNNNTKSSNDFNKSIGILDYSSTINNNNHITPTGISRERSFIRPTNHLNLQNINKRRSLVFQQKQQLRGKPGLEIYRPPNVCLDSYQNKLNVHAQEFTMNRNMELQNSRSSVHLYNAPGNLNNLQPSKSSNNMHQQIQMHQQQQHNRLLHLQQQQHQQALNQQQQQQQQQRLIMSHQMQMGGGLALHQSSHMPLVNSPSSGNILHQSSPRVKFAPEPIIHQQQKLPYQQMHTINNNNSIMNNSLLKPALLPLQRSKSLSSADAIARGGASLGLGLSVEDIGVFPVDVQAVINKASEDPNQLTARCLMELATHCMNRAVEGRRYSLPISRLCLSIISKEHKETFLEALLNTCRQWYQERDKVLGVVPNSKNPARPRFTAFMAFLTEMFCQLKRRQLQLRTQCDGISPAIVLLTLLGRCCEDCVKPPVRSLSEIECLFFVLTCIGRDMEIHLPKELENLLSSVRDAFLNSSASAPAIRRTLLQLIELQASKWQLPCNTVMYYYPSSK